MNRSQGTETSSRPGAWDKMFSFYPQMSKFQPRPSSLTRLRLPTRGPCSRYHHLKKTRTESSLGHVNLDKMETQLTVTLFQNLSTDHACEDTALAFVFQHVRGYEIVQRLNELRFLVLNVTEQVNLHVVTVSSNVTADQALVLTTGFQFLFHHVEVLNNLESCTYQTKIWSTLFSSHLYSRLKTKYHKKYRVVRASLNFIFLTLRTYKYNFFHK